MRAGGGIGVLTSFPSMDGPEGESQKEFGNREPKLEAADGEMADLTSGGRGEGEFEVSRPGSILQRR